MADVNGVLTVLCCLKAGQQSIFYKLYSLAQHMTARHVKSLTSGPCFCSFTTAQRVSSLVQGMRGKDAKKD